MFFFPDFKPKVMAIHGSASTASQWRHLARDLGEDVDFIAPDLPGYGGAAKDSGSRLAALKRAAGAGPAHIHLVGHSFGGAVALKLANTIPERVASVTLYDPIAAIAAHTLAPELDAIWRGFGDGDDATFMQAFLTFWAGVHVPASLDPRQWSRLVAHAPGLRRDMDEVSRGMWVIGDPAYHGPLDIICGAQSPSVSHHMARAIAEDHPQTTITTMAGLGHLAPLTNPEAVNPALCRVLESHGIDRGFGPSKKAALQPEERKLT